MEPQKSGKFEPKVEPEKSGNPLPQMGTEKRGRRYACLVLLFGRSNMENLRIYKITEQYVRFLSGADQRVQHNKGTRRPYVGVVLEVGSYRYFVPMESPKPNHKNLKPSIHIMPLDDGKYGQLGFNNMIPVPASALISFNIDDEPDKQYAALLRHQAAYINRHKADVYHRASRTYFLATSKNRESFFVKICCDFKRLESACDHYDPNYRKKK